MRWYNDSHRHSEIRYVTPAQRHAGLDGQILRQRHKILMQAKVRHPGRWSRGIRNCQPVGEVWLNPNKETPIAHGQKELEAA